MLLTFAGSGYWQASGTVGLRAGTELPADLDYYPGQPPLRALAGDVDGLLAGRAAGIEREIPGSPRLDQLALAIARYERTGRTPK